MCVPLPCVFHCCVFPPPPGAKTVPLSSRPSGRERSEEGGGGGGEAEGRGEAAGGREEDAGQEEEDQLGSYGPPPHKEEGPAAARQAALIHRRRRLPVVLALRFVAASAAGGEQGTGRERCVRPADKTTGGCLVTAFGTAFGRAFHCLWSSISLPFRCRFFTALPLNTHLLRHRGPPQAQQLRPTQSMSAAGRSLQGAGAEHRLGGSWSGREAVSRKVKRLDGETAARLCDRPLVL